MANEQNATSAGNTLPNSEQLKTDANRLKSQAADIADQAKSRATELAEQAKVRGKDQIQTGKQAAADQVEKIADALQQTTEGLQRGEQNTLADYANELANNARNLATNLRERSIEDLLNDAQTLARRNPTIFFLGSVAVGVVLSRFFKASAGRSEQSTGTFAGNEYDRERSSEYAGRQSTATESRVNDLETESASVTEAKGY